MKLFKMLAVWGLLFVGNVCRAEDVLMVFTAQWCGPCQQFKRDYTADKSLAEGYTVEILDIDTAKDLTKDFAVNTVPTFIVVKVGDDGVIKQENIVKRQAGYDGVKKLKRWLER